MASKVDSSVQENTKLPSVVIGHNCLVSPESSLGSTSKSPADIAKNWASDLRRRISENIECHENVNEDDIMAFKRELIGIFITTLQHDSHFQWSVFVEILGLIEPYKELFDYFDSKAEFFHYLERILHHVNMHKEHLFDLHIEDSLMKIFPEHVRQIKAKGPVPVKNYCSSPQLMKSTKFPSSTHQPCNQIAMPYQHLGKHLPDGTNPYAAYIPTYEEISGFKQLTMRDLSKSMSAVALEMASREAIWSYPLGTTALAMATVLPDTDYEENVSTSSPADAISQTMPLTLRFMKTTHPVPKMLEEVRVMNGREAVQFFTSCNHLGKIKSMFLNLAQNEHYSPYDLITVPKIKVNPEHYVFSTFGALHVYPDQPSESLSLAEWQREAVLWKAVASIPFFKNFLRAKAFYRWRANQQYTEFQRLQRRILRNLLSARPPFGAALLQIARLLKELLTVPFLPMDVDKTYQLGDFKNCINYKTIQAEKIVARFFKYCKLVVDFTAEEARKKLHHCEKQVKKKTPFTKDAMYLQKKKKQERENNLKDAKREASFLGNFVKLVDYMVVEHIFEITKTQGINFVYNVLEIDRNTPREGFFKANLVFNEHDALCISPPRECFQNALRNSLLGIPSVFISKVISIDDYAIEKDTGDGHTNISNHGHIHLYKQSLSSDHIISQNKSGEVYGISSFQQDNNQTARLLLDYASKQGLPYEDKTHVESVKATTGNYMSQPDLIRQQTPTKEDDDLGVATPDLVIKNAASYSLQVEGEGFMGQYSPLSRANLEEKLFMDQEYQAAVLKQNDLMTAAFDEINNYCEINKWLNDIQHFCHKWTETSVQQFSGVASFAIEQKLTELFQWSDRVRNFDSSFLTEASIFYIDCSTIHEGLLPKLDAIYQEIISFIANEAQTLATNFAEEMNAVLKNLKNKSSNVSSFAAFAKNFGDYKKNTLEFQQRAEYIKSLFEVIRMSTRQLAPDEEKTEERVLSLWETFLMQMQDASEFVNTQAPLMTQQLEDTFQFFCKEAIQQAELATSGQFLEISNNPLKILADMKLIQEKFYKAQTQLQEVSQWKEAIMGESCNLNFMNDITSKMNIRHELWKYVETSTYTIKDWKKMLLKKFNIEKALEKVTEWQLASTEFKSHLPKEDNVLTAWCKQIQLFSKDLPILHKLANDALQERHWHAIFLGINEPYDPNHQFTVTDLMSYNLSDHADIIYTICKNAAAEYDLEQCLNHISDFWQNQHFKLAKHIPDSILNKLKEHPKRTMSSNKRLRKLERYSQERAAAAMHVDQRSLDVTSDDFFVLIDLEELKYLLEDSRISVDAMMASPYVHNIREKVMFLCQALREIEEITDLWIECQKKWLYLLKIFEKTDLYCKLPQQALMFEDVHSKFKDWMRVVSNDSRCLSVVSRRRGDKGYRLLQGDNLRSLFLSAIKEQEKILKDLEVFIERSRANFPRLYFLSNFEIVELLGISRNLPALIPFVQKCFLNVQNLTFALPTSMAGLNSQLDHDLHSDKLEVVSVQGVGGEDLSLYTQVVATSSATKWMHSLNESLKNTMVIALRACVQARIEEGSRQPILILEELARLDSCSSVQGKANDVRSNFHHWLLRFPVQCVITAEAIMWERGMTRALEKQDKNELIILRSSLCAKLEQLVDVLQEVQTRFQISNRDRQRLELLFCGLLNQCIYHRDIMEKLIQSNEVTDSAFDWLKILKFHMDIRNVLRAKTVITENASTTNVTGQKTLIKALKKSSVSKRQKNSLVLTQEAPKLTRTQTTVSTDYQFSACYVQQLSNVFSYDYEYLGPCNHIVMTPLTERAFLAMGHALKTFYCGTMIGPSGTGKTETLRELSRVLGRCMFTVSCHESITFATILQYLTGMVQSGCWALFDDTDRLTKGLLSVAGQQLDYLRTALRALDVNNENQYQIRGHSHFDKKSGLGDKVIRRNSLTTLHPLTKAETNPTPLLDRQKTVPHGFNEKGLVTYFQDNWVAERDQRRHSIEREIEIKESNLYKSNKQPPLFYEHVKANRKRLPQNYSKLNTEPLYVHRMLGNVMLNGKLIEASSNFGCFLTLNANNPNTSDIPYNFRVLMRPCALIVPDLECIISVTLQSYGYKEHKLWTKKLTFFFKFLETQMPKQRLHTHYLREIKSVLILAAGKRIDSKFQNWITEDSCGIASDAQWRPDNAEETSKIIEEHSLIFALKKILVTRYDKLAESTQFLHILREVFPHIARWHNIEDASFNQKMTMAITDIFKEDHLDRNDVMFRKILQLHSALETQTPVILMGPSGSGKTKVYQTLARAINMLNYKLYAPDHSKDELTSGIDVQDDATQKFKSVITTDEMIKKSPHDFAEYPKIDVIHLFPGAMTPLELLGMFENGMWHGGLLGKIVRDSHFMWLATKSFLEHHKSQERKNFKTPTEPPSILQKWLVLDGDLDPLWTEEVKTLLDDERRLSLGNGESLLLKDTNNLIFETTDLKAASPSTISRCCIVHCGPCTTNWSALYFSWKQNASTKWLLSAVGLKILDDLVNDVIPSTVKFLVSECQTALLTDVGDITVNHVIPGVTEISAFLGILSAMLDRSLNRAEMEKKIRMQETKAREEDTSISPSRQMGSSLTTSSQIETIIPNYKEILKGMFAFSYIWAFGGHLHDRFKETFSKMALDALYRARHSVCLPLSDLVFDYYLDESTASFVKWSNRQQQGYIKNLAGFIVTPEYDRYAYLLELLMASHQPVLLTGVPGVGKTSLIRRMVLSKVPSTTVTMSRGLTSPILQDLLMSHVLDTQNKSTPTVGTSVTISNHTRQRHFFFIDDISMAPIVGGYQPNVELIRSIFTVGGIYDKQRKVFHKMEEAVFIAATTLPSVPGTGLGIASHVISSRLSRQFINLTLFTPSDDSLLNLYSRPLQTWLEEFPSHAVEHHFEFAKAMSKALLELYQLVKGRLRPCPSMAHYIFSLHDLSRVIQGIMLMSPRTSIKKKTTAKEKVEQDSSVPMMNVIAQLWCHEVTRCFGDRIIHANDQTWFNGVVEDLVIKYFCSSQDDTSHEFSAKIKEQPKSAQIRDCQFVSTPPNVNNVFDVHEDARELTERITDFWPEPRPYSKEELHKTSSTSSSVEKCLADTIQHSRSSMTETSQNVTVISESTYRSHEIPDTTTTGITDIEPELGELSIVSSVCDDENGEKRNKTTFASSGSVESDTEESDSESPDSLYSKTSTSLPESFKSSLDVLTFPSRESTCSDLYFEVTLENSVVASESSENSSVASIDGLRDIPDLKQQGSSNTKLHVTFKSALIMERENETYNGPLLSYHDIKTRNINLTNFIFSKFYMACHAETLELQTEKGYAVQTEEVLSEALHTCLSKYSKESSQRLNLVFFSEAVHHAARLSRVLAYPKGHALLLSAGYSTGRTTLARLASFVAQCKLFEPKPQSLPMHNLSMVRTHIKQSCFHAGVNGKPTVLLVHEEMGDQCLQDVCAVMAEGTVPGIYTDEEIQVIVTHMMPGGVQTKRVDKIQQAFERYGKRIRQNLHVLVCLNYTGNRFSKDAHTLHSKLQRYPSLIKNSCSIDFYQPWSFRAFVHVARICLEDTRCGIIVPWSPERRAEQIVMASNSMAYIHLTAKAAIERQFCHWRDPLRIFTPLTFLEFIHMFKIVSAFLVKTEKAKGAQFEKALKKIDEAFGSIAEYKRKVSDLQPQSTSAGGVINDLVAQVEALKESYRQALVKCKSQEEKIIKLQEPLEKLRKSTKTEFDKVNPIYLAAAKVLDKLDHGAVEELRSYPSPPEGVKFVMKAVCLLFGKPQTWEDAKSLMVDTGFFQELIFYKKDSIPDEVLTELKAFVTNPLFAPENVAQASTAASSISAWVNAVFAYSSIHQKMKPHMKSLLNAENKLAKAQAQLGQLRVDANNMKINLEQYINQHKEAVKEARAIEKQILAIERKIAQANNLMENMSVQHFLWRSELKRTRKHIVSAPGDALITSACLVYHGPLSDMSRIDLLHEWLDQIKQNALDERAFVNREPYSTTVNLELPIVIDQQQGHLYHKNGDASEVKTFKYTSAVHDDTSYYRSELKRQDTIQTAVPEDFMDDSDDDENCSLPIRPNLAIQEIVSDFDELSEWRMQNLPTDLLSIQNALIIRSCCYNHKHSWPLLIDPDNQAEMWVRALQGSQNIFTEKDVASFFIDDAIPFEESNNQKNDQRALKSPSRGTLSTFLEATESVYTDSHSLNTPICRAMTRQNSQSCHVDNGDEPQNATSVNNNYYLKVDLDTSGFSDTNFEVLMADDPDINFKLISAVVQGVKVLITHLERKPLDSIFRGLLLKQFYVDKDDNKIIKVGDKAIKYHPNFCLYLSTSVPLFLKGDGIYKSPLHHLCVINMAMSDEAIFNRLMYETMKVEKKEFENQRRSNEKDIILHRQRLAREHEIIREKTVTLTGPLLDDNTMLDSLIVCHSNVEHNCLILEETRYMGNHLEDKFSHYTPLIKNSSVLYNVLHKMAVLHPFYYLPFYKFVEIFSTVIKSRDRGKGSVGAPQVRTQELLDAVLQAIFKYVKLMMFEEHYNLLTLLVSLERLLRQHKASIKELSIFVNGFKKNELVHSSLFEQKPQWMNNGAWLDCNILESLHQPFLGLCSSLIKNDQQWEEYFQKGVNLGSLVPGSTLQDLSLFQKCLLWKLICPHRMAQLSLALALHELGSSVSMSSDDWNIHEIYKLTDKHTPTVFLLPTLKNNKVLTGTKGYPFVCPASEVKQLAKEIGMEGKVRVLNFGVSSQMLEIKNAIADCLHLGHWLLLQNYHLSEEPDPEFFRMLKDIIYAQLLEDDNKIDATDLYVELQSPSMSANTSKIHQSFRLWITTTVNEERVMPGLLLQHGLRVTCKATGNFKNLLNRSYKSVSSLMRANNKAGEEMVQKFSRVMPFALLHAIIMQQCYYGRSAFVQHNFWTLTDLATTVDYVCNLSGWTKDADAVNDLSAWVYARHCQDLFDACSVHAVIKDLVQYGTLANQALLYENRRVGLLLQRLVVNFRETGDLQKTLDSIEDCSARIIYLSNEAEEQLVLHKSKILMEELVQTTGAPELLLMSHKISGTPVTSVATTVITSLLDLLSACPELPKTSPTQIIPLDSFFNQEVASFKELLQTMHNDLIILSQAAHAKISLTAKMQSILEDICNDDIPAAWLDSAFVTCSSLKLWLSELPVRMNFVKDCVVQCPAILSLNMFLRPDRLFWVILQTYAQQNFKDVTEITLHFQVMPEGLSPSMPPDNGVFIDGLEMKNATWDSIKSILSDNTLCTHTTHAFPVLWAKPHVERDSNYPDVKNEFYNCPVYGARESHLNNDTNILWMIPLATLEPPTFWSQKRVAFTLTPAKL